LDRAGQQRHLELLMGKLTPGGFAVSRPTVNHLVVLLEMKTNDCQNFTVLRIHPAVSARWQILGMQLADPKVAQFNFSARLLKNA